MQWRWHLPAIAGLLLVCAAVPAESRGEEGAVEPYTGFINSDDVYVRSGPGQNYYPVLRLRRGQTVDVYRHDPGGWYAIRPPQECFSWVAAEFIEPGEGRMATVKAEHVVARVGSAFSDIRDVIQVRLEEGEQVEVLEARRIGTGPAAQTWYKIAPPAGEFRWISGQFIDRDAPGAQSAKRDPNKNLLIARHAQRGAGDGTIARKEQTRDSASPADSDDDADRPAATPARRDRNRSTANARHEEDEDEADRDGGRENVRDLSDWKPPTPARRRNAPAGDQELLKELEEIDVELSAQVAKDPSTWDLKQIRWRTEALLTRSDTALDRGRVRLLQRKVARFEDIQQRHEKIALAQRRTDSQNQEIVRASLGGSINSPGAPAAGGRYDGVGKLTQVDPAQTGVAGFALVNAGGQVTQFVTPAPGVNLRPYLGREVGVQGTLGYMTDARTPHVTAKRITVVEEAPLRR